MKICIPTETDRGLAAPVHPHFGRAPFFSIVDLETGDLETVKNPQCHQHPHACHHLAILKAHAVDTVVTTHVGHRALESLQRAGVCVLRTPSNTVEGTIEAVRAGKCQTAITPEGACHGHGHGGRHGSGCGHGHGHGRGGGPHGFGN